MKTIILIIMLLASTTAFAEDFVAKQFVQQKCSSCHTQTVYTRADRKVASLAGLNNQVQRCDANLGLKMFPEEIDAVTQFLNNDYYHFEKK